MHNHHKHRFGFFFLSEYNVRHKNAADIFAKLKFVPIEVKQKPFESSFLYYGLSPYFDLIPDNIWTLNPLVPQYVLKVNWDEMKLLDVEIRNLKGNKRKTTLQEKP